MTDQTNHALQRRVMKERRRRRAERLRTERDKRRKDRVNVALGLLILVAIGATCSMAGAAVVRLGDLILGVLFGTLSGLVGL